MPRPDSRNRFLKRASHLASSTRRFPYPVEQDPELEHLRNLGVQVEFFKRDFYAGLGPELVIAIGLGIVGGVASGFLKSIGSDLYEVLKTKCISALKQQPQKGMGFRFRSVDLTVSGKIGSLYFTASLEAADEEAVDSFFTGLGVRLQEAAITQNVAYGSEVLLYMAREAEWEVTTVDPAPPMSIANCAISSYNSNNVNAAIKDLTLGLQQHPDSSILAALLGACYLRQESFQLSIEAYLHAVGLVREKLKTAKPSDTARLWKELVDLLYQQVNALYFAGEHEHALRILEEIERTYLRQQSQPKTNILYYRRAQILTKLARDSEAVDCLQKALESDPAVRDEVAGDSTFDSLRSLNNYKTLFTPSNY